MNKIWTKSKCINEVSKYTTKKDFRQKSNEAYQAACRHGWLEEITNCLIGKKRRGFWNNKEKCRLEALKYDSLTDFKEKSNAAYRNANNNDWLTEITKHMNSLGHKYKRCIYCYEFDDNSVYVGLTYNIEKRNAQHYSDKTSKVYQHMLKTFIIPKLKILTNYINVEEAQTMESYFVTYYKDSGFVILNKHKTGAIGSCVVKWTKEICKKESLQYKTHKDFRRGCLGAYNKSYKMGWLKEFTHLKRNRWTYENCLKMAKQYNSRSEFKKGSPSAYGTSVKNKWLDEICSHMTNNPFVLYWTFEKCQEEANLYNTRTLYYKRSCTSYNIALKNNWLDEICSHMIKRKIWTYDECEKISILCKNKYEMKCKYSKQFYASRTNGWLNDFFQ